MFALSAPFRIGHRLDPEASNTGKGHTADGGENLSDLDFADDTAAVVGDTQDLRQWLGIHKIYQTLVTEISDSASSLGFTISAKKTKNMLTGTLPSPSGVSIDQNEVEVVDDFTYLGSFINSSGDIGKKLNSRPEKTSAALNGLKKIRSSKKLPLNM